MRNRTESTASAPTTWRARLAQAWGVGLLLALVVIFSAYAWTAREAGTTTPASLVTLRPHLRGNPSTIDVVPYQHEIAPAQPTCTTSNAGQLCLIIGSEPIDPDTMTFT